MVGELSCGMLIFVLFMVDLANFHLQKLLMPLQQYVYIDVKCGDVARKHSNCSPSK